MAGITYWVRRAVCVAAACSAVGLLWPQRAPAQVQYSPQSPEVQQMVARAVAYLENSNDGRWGAEALVGLTMLKAGKPKDHPRVQRAVQFVQAALANPRHTEDIVYSTGLATVFLAELDAQQYRPELETLLRSLLEMQKQHGGWGYRDKFTGDTSMTQYGVLGMWACWRNGIDTPLDAWDRVAGWLLSTQDPGGAWGYQGQLNPMGGLTQQTEIRHSMAAAGISSLLICVDHFGLSRSSDAGAPTGDQVIGLRPVEEAPPPDERKQPSGSFPAGNGRAALERADAWLLQQNYTVSPQVWQQYYLYAFERYHAFRELVTGQEVTSPPWYDDGVKWLQGVQQQSGAWSGSAGQTVPDTCFATLFLLRSTKASILHAPALGAGLLQGGRGLPENGDLSLNMGQVRAKPLVGPAEELLSIIGDPNHPDYDRAVAGLEQLAAEADQEELSANEERLRALAGGDDPALKAAAIQLLGRGRRLGDVPLILDALTDPSPDVFFAAVDALRFISRTFPSPEDEIDPASDAARQAVIQRWTQWYDAVRPETDDG